MDATVVRIDQPNDPRRWVIRHRPGSNGIPDEAWNRRTYATGRVFGAVTEDGDLLFARTSEYVPTERAIHFTLA